jgi:hypothetical protein
MKLEIYRKKKAGTSLIYFRGSREWPRLVISVYSIPTIYTVPGDMNSFQNSEDGSILLRSYYFDFNSLAIVVRTVSITEVVEPFSSPI